MTEAEKKKIEELTLAINQKTEQANKLKAEILKYKEERTALKLLPFHAGDEAICTLPDNKNTHGKPFRCIIEISGDTVYAAPFKKDGTVSGRHYMIVPEEGNTYEEYLQKG